VGTRNIRQVGNLSYRHAFTLLELMLALGLSIVVLAAIGMSITTYLRLFDSGRAKIEEAQLARALLRRMADDIRGTVLHNPVDASKLVPTTSGTGTTSATEGAASAETASTAGSASGASLDPTQIATTTGSSTTNGSTTDGSTTMTDGSESGTTAVDDTTDLSTAAPQTTPGLYGNSTQLQIDVSRLPRIDQYLAVAYQDNTVANQNAGSTPVDHLSDLRNVAYYISSDSASISGNPTSISGNSTMNPGSANSTQQTCSGLVRRDMDRASVLYASQTGATTDMNAAGKPIAPEVESIQFAYYDGTEWLSSWDSTQNGGLPLAVQITLAITRPANRNGEIPPPGVYSLLVSIPTDQSSSAASSSSSSSSSTSSSSSSTSQTPTSNSSQTANSTQGNPQSNPQSNTQSNTPNSSSGKNGQQKTPGGK
jgi:hypothetical protein